MLGAGEWFGGLHPVAQALLAGCLTWAVTALGAALVFPFRALPRALLDAMLGFAAGVMIAASVWSLLLPAIELAADAGGGPAWAPAAAGVVLGALALRLADALLPHLHPGLPLGRAEGPPTPWRRTTLLVLAITLHNAPEGLAVGVAFGAAALGAGSPGGATLGAAVALAVGIAIQNFPEGVAVAMPLRREGVAPGRCFWFGQLSAAIEPLAAALGAAAALAVAPVLPYALAFAAGAMLFVVVEELIPESQQGGHADLATTGAIAGFTVMMVLDVALG
jgi:ZIP family zinc transporter